MGIASTNFILCIYIFAALSGVFFALGWCDPGEYKKQPMLDGLSGLATVFAFVFVAKLLSLGKELTKGLGFSKSLMEFGQAYYEDMVSSPIIGGTANEMMGLIQVGVANIIYFLAGIVAIILSVYFIFRMMLLLDLYINNTIRHLIMSGGLVAIIILGIVFGQVRTMIIFALFGVLSFVVLAGGNFMSLKESLGNMLHPGRKSGGPALREFPGKRRPPAPRPGQRPMQQPMQQRPVQPGQQPMQQRPVQPGVRPPAQPPVKRPAYDYASEPLVPRQARPSRPPEKK